MAYESKSFKKHHLTRLPVLDDLLKLGWDRNQIICPSPDSEDTEWYVPITDFSSQPLVITCTNALHHHDLKC